MRINHDNALCLVGPLIFDSYMRTVKPYVMFIIIGFMITQNQDFLTQAEFQFNAAWSTSDSVLSHVSIYVA